MLDSWERVVTDEVMAIVEAGTGDARAKLRRLFALAVSHDDLTKVELAIREWARHETVPQRLRRIDNRRMEYMRLLFGKLCPNEHLVEVRCLLASSVFIANHFVVADHSSRSRAEVVSLIMSQLLA